MVELGLGLLSIGRPWGHRGEGPPPERDAFALLEKAAALGIRFFDTAPAYGTSEAIFGRFLRESGAHAVVSTKMGEWWDSESGTSTVDHSYDALARSIDRSLERLGRIDILQIHKATAACLAARDVSRAVEYARECGIREFGASVSDLAAAQAASESGWCSYLQFPFNQANAALAPIFDLGLKCILNRPLAMGAIQASAEAFAFIRRQAFEGVVLTGTKSTRHLVDNHAAFYATRHPDS